MTTEELLRLLDDSGFAEVLPPADLSRFLAEQTALGCPREAVVSGLRLGAAVGERVGERLRGYLRVMEDRREEDAERLDMLASAAAAGLDERDREVARLRAVVLDYERVLRRVVRDAPADLADASEVALRRAGVSVRRRREPEGAADRG